MTDPDRRLARRARRGDRRALAELYERHRGRLLGYLAGVVGSAETAEEVFQEVWIKVMQRIDGYRPGPATFRAWLYRIASNAGIDRLRREALRGAESLDEPTGDEGALRVDRIASAAPGPERLAGSALARRSLAPALRSLSEDQRTALLLRHQQGMSYGEVAAATGTTEGTAKTRVHRAVLRLREVLGDPNDA